MKISVEVSYYPLNSDYIPHIKNFIDRLNLNKKITVKTNTMSTQIFGEYEEVFGTLQKEIKQSFSLPHSVFVMKIINADLEK